MVFKCLVREHHNEGLSKRLGYLRGITNSIPISTVIGLANNDFFDIHEITKEAEKNRNRQGCSTLSTLMAKLLLRAVSIPPFFNHI